MTVHTSSIPYLNTPRKILVDDEMGEGEELSKNTRLRRMGFFPLKASQLANSLHCVAGAIVDAADVEILVLMIIWLFTHPYTKIHYNLKRRWSNW